jgi:hypothetical protein
MAKKYILTLSEEELTALQEQVARRRGKARELVRVQCLLAVATNGLGWSDAQTHQAYGLSVRSLERLRQSACTQGVEAALRGQPRQHWPESKFTGQVVAHLLACRCSEPPAGHARWSLQLLADQLVALHLLDSASKASVGRVLKKTSSSPGNEKCG